MMSDMGREQAAKARAAGYRFEPEAPSPDLGDDPDGDCEGADYPPFGAKIDAPGYPPEPTDAEAQAMIAELNSEVRKR